MKKRSHLLMIRGSVVALIFFWIFAIATASAAFKFLQEGMVAPEFKGKDLRDGSSVVWKPGAAAELGGTDLVVFWATWSPRSLEILTDLKELSGKYGPEKFRVIAINVDAPRLSSLAHKQIVEVAVELDLPFPMMIDEGLNIFYSYGVIAVPSIAMMDEEGILRYGPAGYSYVVRDRIVDSTEVLLGLREPEVVETGFNAYKPKSKAARYYNLGLQLFGKRHYERAMDNLDRSVEADSLFSAPHGLKGQINLTLGEYAKAEGQFASAVALDSTSVAAWAGWGRSLMELDRTEQACEKLDLAIKLDDTFTPALLDLAQCRLRSDQWEKAKDLLTAARNLNPRDPEVLYRLGLYYRQKDDLDAAVAAYRQAMEQLVTLPVIGEEP